MSEEQFNPNIEIKTLYEIHNCSRTLNNNRITSDFLAMKYLNDIIDDPTIKPEALVKKVYQNLQANVSDSSAYRAIVRGRNIINGDINKQYSRLWDYCEMIRRTNLGSRATIEVEHVAYNADWPHGTALPPRFKRLYMRYEAQKQGFIAGCRPFIGLNGCHLKGDTGGNYLLLQPEMLTIICTLYVLVL